ncbi:hypothetical protein ACIBH1_46960 [Nonomuraea sp. NPDC050663]|uniref:hypothetical protein n=1 Tax=Nonomuraea sp. NPDC050663 TaxID=3364370 RepID=UPI0037BD6CCF
MSSTDAMAAVTHLRRPGTQQGQHDTLLLLGVGLDLIGQALAQDSYGLTFTWPSRAQLIKKYNMVTGLRASKGLFEDRWATMGDYYADLFAWALHPAQWVRHQQVAEKATANLRTAPSFSATARHAALLDIQALTQATSFRIKLVLCATHPIAPAHRAALRPFYQAARDWWSVVYEAVLNGSRRALRPDVPMAEFVAMMTAIEEGLVLHYLSSPQSFDRSMERLAEILATGAMALILGASAPEGDAEPLSTLCDRLLSYPSQP